MSLSTLSSKVIKINGPDHETARSQSLLPQPGYLCSEKGTIRNILSWPTQFRPLRCAKTYTCIWCSVASHLWSSFFASSHVLWSWMLFYPECSPIDLFCFNASKTSRKRSHWQGLGEVLRTGYWWELLFGAYLSGNVLWIIVPNPLVPKPDIGRSLRARNLSLLGWRVSQHAADLQTSVPFRRKLFLRD